MPAYQLLKLVDYQHFEYGRERCEKGLWKEKIQERIDDSTVAISCGIYPLVRTMGSDLFTISLA